MALAVCALLLAGTWPTGSHLPVAPLDHPTLETRAASLEPGPEHGYRFVVFGDQRALADREWPTLVRRIGELAAADGRLLFMVDTGDIVNDGRYADQFPFARKILAPARALPYLVGVGNHEVYNNRSGVARDQLSAFLRALDAGFAPDRMYYRKDVGPLRLLFLDSNDLVYGPGGRGPAREAARAASAASERADRPADGPATGRETAQLDWLQTQLDEIAAGPSATVVVVMHHPFVQSSPKHSEEAGALWSYRYHGKTLPDLLLDGGVDVVLCGHTHTYERFRVQRPDGRSLVVINFSGRPRSSFLWFGAGSRRARDIRGHEQQWLAAHGWHDLSGWQLAQEDAMTASEADQFGVFTVEPAGGLLLELCYLEPAAPGGVRRVPAVRLH